MRCLHSQRYVMGITLTTHMRKPDTMIASSPQASRQVFVNRSGGAPACTHGQNDGGCSSHNIAAGEDTQTAEAPNRGSASRGQASARMLISITISIGLRYCANIRPMFCQTLGENQPSWKFSLLPQNAQKQATKVEMETAAHPAIWCRFAL
jgi:hypothetical protein